MKTIQADTLDAVAAMEKSTVGVVEGAKLSDNAGTALSEIDRVSRRLAELIDIPQILQLPPMGYLEMLGLMQDARLVLTDSGGIQEETTALGVPCVTLRNNTERPITVEQGTNTIAGNDPEKILAIFRDVIEHGGMGGRVPEFWDGHAADRIAQDLCAWLDQRRAAA